MKIVFGVILIYNMLIFDVINLCGNIWYVGVCGEVGVLNMVDGLVCVLGGFGVVFMSMGMVVGNVVGVMVEVLMVGIVLLYVIG